MHKMVYPENFESKIKFDKIRQFVQKNCLSDMGRDLVEAMKFSTEPTEIRERLEETQEFMSILEEEDQLLKKDLTSQLKQEQLSLLLDKVQTH